MKKILLLSAVFITLLSTSCNKDKTEPEKDYDYKKKSVSSNTFINSYVNPCDAITYLIELKNYPYIDLGDNTHWSTGEYHIDKIGIICSSTSDTNIKNPQVFPTNDCNEELFDQVAADNSDSGYDGYYWDSESYLFSPISKFSITCSQDYDANHPAGAILNDITEINYYTAQPFIESNYKNIPLGDYEKSRTVEPLNEFVKKSVNLVRFDIYLRLTRKPQNAGVYQFTVTYCNADGATLSATTVPINLLTN